eukprot:PhF_6_TR24266/c0_g1_i1/m.33721
MLFPSRPSSASSPRKLTIEEMEHFAKRLTVDDIKVRTSHLEELKKRVYQTEDSAPQLTKTRQQQSVRRMYYVELERREKNMKQLDERYFPTVPTRKLASMELDDQIHRNYNDAIQRKKTTMKALEAKYDFEKKMEREELGEDDSPKKTKGSTSAADQQKKTRKSPPRRPMSAHKKLTKSEQKALGDRLKKPKKKVLTEDEINKILGLAS